MNFSNILLLSSLVLPAAFADRLKPGLAVQIYVPIEAAEYATVTAKILGPEPETMSSSTFNETDKICKNNVWDDPDSFSISDFCMAEPKYVSITRLEGITGDEVRSVNISMPGYNLTVSLANPCSAPKLCNVCADVLVYRDC
jgi:hypothetical protein